MKKLLQSEQFAQMALCFFLIYLSPVHLSWWVYVLLFFAPDLSMIGYAINPRIGGWMYNLAHLKSIAALLIGVGFAASEEYVLLCGLMMWAHAAFDRMLGYGLKHQDSFNHTHLGWIGKDKHA